MNSIVSVIKGITRAAVTLSAFFLFGCTVALTHVPGSDLQDLKMQQPPRIVVADIGDVRDHEEPTIIAEGFSEWLPIVYYATDQDEKPLPVSYFVAQSLSEDMQKLGYVSMLANDAVERKPMAVESAMEIARSQNAEYVVTTKVTDGKTNFWGFLLIPFMEPVWTRIGYDVQVFEVGTGASIPLVHVFQKDTEWYFGKITITDSIIDAGLFGKSWIGTAWGKTFVPGILAGTAKQVSSEIQKLRVHPAAAL
jgi:hypothetical protein